MILTVTANPNNISYRGKSTIIADLLHDSDGMYHDPVNGVVPDGITVKFSSDGLGIITPITNAITNGSANSTFTGHSIGVSAVSAMVDDQTVITNVTIETTTIKINVNPRNGYKGDNVDLTAVLTDIYNIPVSGKTVKFSVNGKFVGTAITNAQGIATLSYKITQSNGIYSILALFMGDETYAGNSNTNNLTVNLTPTDLTVKNVTG